MEKKLIGIGYLSNKNGVASKSHSISQIISSDEKNPMFESVDLKAVMIDMGKSYGIHKRASELEKLDALYLIQEDTNAELIKDLSENMEKIEIVDISQCENNKNAAIKLLQEIYYDLSERKIKTYLVANFNRFGKEDFVSTFIVNSYGDLQDLEELSTSSSYVTGISLEELNVKIKKHLQGKINQSKDSIDIFKKQIESLYNTIDNTEKKIEKYSSWIEDYKIVDNNNRDEKSTKNSVRYFEFEEKNDWEGEIWTVFFQEDDIEKVKLIESLIDIISNNESLALEYSLNEISKERYESYKVIGLDSDFGYYPRYDYDVIEEEKYECIKALISTNKSNDSDEYDRVSKELYKLELFKI